MSNLDPSPEPVTPAAGRASGPAAHHALVGLQVAVPAGATAALAPRPG
jgi:hypothetical protein